MEWDWLKKEAFWKVSIEVSIDLYPLARYVMIWRLGGRKEET